MKNRIERWITSRAQDWLRAHGFIVLIPISDASVWMKEVGNGLFVTDNDFDERMIKIRLFSGRARVKLGATIHPEKALALAEELSYAALAVMDMRGRPR